MRTLPSKKRRIHWPWFGRKAADYRQVMRPAHRRLTQEPLESRMLLAVSPVMIDLDSASYSNPEDFLTIGEQMFFTAEDTSHGRELWVTDGTTAGTHLVKDINDGTDSSNPLELTAFNGKLYFVADDGENGQELWRSDGTTSGTVLVKDIYPGTGVQYPYPSGPLQSFPRDLTVVNGFLYFSAEDGDYGAELWRTDGTTSGTVLVKDLYTGTFTEGSETYPNSSNPMNFVGVGTTLYFTADNGTGVELWKSDGTAAGTTLVKDIYTGTHVEGGETVQNSSNPQNMTAVGSVLYFVAEDATHGLELWKSDGTSDGTALVKDIYAGTADAFNEDSSLVAMNGVLYFTATDATYGDELWRSNGTAAGTYLVKDINSGSDGDLSYYNGLTVFGNNLYFAADNGSTGKELWKSDGTTAGTVLLKEIYSGAESSHPYYMKVIGDALYFSADSEAYGHELWKTDGTTAGTVRLTDVRSGTMGTYPSSIEAVGGVVMFNGYVGTGTEYELYALSLGTPTRLSIWINGVETTIPAGIGVYSGGSLADVYTSVAGGELKLDETGATLGDFFDVWRTNGGNAGNNTNATFDHDTLMGNNAIGTYTVQMFVDGELRTDYEDYVIRGGEEIILVYTDNTVVSLVTNYGSIVMELFDDETPNTVANFLAYVNDGDFINSIFHRSIADYIIQGGNSTTSSTTYTSTSQFTEIADNGGIAAELGVSNTRGTVAMARVGTDMSSATNNFFINVKDNTNLNTQDGGYTVFGRVLDMTAVDAINDLPSHNADSGGTFATLPYDDATKQLVVVQSIEGMGTITGKKFYDTDGDGILDTGESGIAGATVYVDANDNGALDTGEISTTTASDGSYTLNVAAGSHVVRSVVSAGAMATVDGLQVSVEIGETNSGENLGEIDVPAPTAVDLVTASDTGSSSTDNLTKLNNAATGVKLQFLVAGVINGAEVRIYSDGVLIGTGTASGTSITITTDGATTIADGTHQITAKQVLDGELSDASPALAVTIDATGPAAIASTPGAIAEILVSYTFNADSPDEGQTGITYSLVNAPAGMTIDAATGVVAWTPTAEQDVPQLFDIVVSDAAGNTSVRTVDMTVLGVIAAYPESYTVYEDDDLSVNANAGVLNNDDPDNEFGTLTVSLVAQASHGIVTLNSDGSFTYEPTDNYSGTDSFTYRATDGTDESNEAKVTITVAAVNDAPVGQADSYTINEDVVLTKDAAAGVLANDSDLDDDTLTATLGTGPAHGTVILNTDGSFTYTPNANYSGTDSFTYVLGDGTTTAGPITVTLTINGVNDAPTATNDAYTTNEDTVLTVVAADGVLKNDTDPEGDTLTAALVSNASHGTVTLASNGSFTYTPNANYYGTDSFTYRVSDGTNTSATKTVTITVSSVNDAPVATDDAHSAVNNGTTYTYSVLTNDTDVESATGLTISAVTQGNHGGTISISGSSVLYTPAAGYTGTETFTYTVSDGDGGTDTATVTMTVTAGSGSQTTGGTLSGYAYIDKNGNGKRDSGETGIPGVQITLTGTAGSTAITAKKALTDDNGYYRFDGLAAGTYVLTETQPEIMVDGAESSATTTATITNDKIANLVLADNGSLADNNFGEKSIQSEYVTFRMFLASTPAMKVYLRNLVAYGEDCAGNDDLADDIREGETDYTDDDSDNHVPAAVANTYTVNENTTLTVPVATGVLANDTDADTGDTLTASLVTTTTHGTLTLASNGSFTYTPNTNYVGTDSFTYRAFDGTAASNVVTVTITISEANDAPVADADTYTVDADTTLTVTAANGVLNGDTDADGNTLTASLVTTTSHGTLSLQSTGAFTYIPNAGYVGTDSFTYKASDGTLQSGVATVTITVGANHAPVAVANHYTTNQNTTLTIGAASGLLWNDTDVDGNTLTASVVSTATSGTLTLNSNGSFTYVPTTGYSGNVTFTYRAYDGTAYSNTVTVTIAVGTNHTPTADTESYTVDENGSLTVTTASGVLAGDADSDGDTLIATLVTTTTHGTLTLKPDGSFTYVPTTGYTGSDSFSYRASDGTLQSTVTTVTITVGTNHAPTADNDSYTVSENTVLTINAANGVLNGDADSDLDTLTAVLASNPSRGTLAMNADGSFTYTPAVNDVGTVTFTYRASDGGLNSALATVTITITEGQDVPVTEADSYTIAEDTVLTVDSAAGLLGNDDDADGDDLDVVIVDAPSHGTLDMNEDDGSFTYTPELNYVGTVTFTYYATDGTLDSAETTVTITITAVNDDAPVAVADAVTMAENTTLVRDAAAGVLANDYDPDAGTTLTAEKVSDPEHGTLTFNSDGSYSYTPATNYVGTDTFTYKASDGALFSEVVTVTITIEEGSDAPVAVVDLYTVGVDVPLNVNVSAGVLANDTDADEGDTLTAILVDEPANGDIEWNEDGSFVYTPDTGFHGTDSFSYKAKDAGGLESNTVLVRIDVNNPATVDADAYSVDEDGTLTVTAGEGVLVGDSDPDGDTLIAVVVTGMGPQNGTLTLEEDGSFVYTPNPNFHGTDTFTYTAQDSYLNPTQAIVTITVNSIEDAPIGGADDYIVAMNQPLVIDDEALGVLANDTDGDGDALTAVKLTDPEHGTLTFNDDGTFTYTPATDYYGSDTFTYKATDATGESAPVTVTIWVNAPVTAVDDSEYHVNEDGELAVDEVLGVLANDVNLDDDDLIAELVSDVSNGDLTFNADGSFTYTPTADFHGTDSFTYSVSDGHGSTSQATVTIVVDEVLAGEEDWS